MLDECAARLASERGDTSLCPIVTDASGKKTLLTKLPKNPSYPAAIHDCAGASEKVVGLLSLAPDADPKMKAEAGRAISFVKKSCAARGTWVWTGGHFVRR